MIALVRCQQHPGQAAAARCPSCQQSFCRECVTEHDGRMLCLACFAKRSQREAWERARGGHGFWVVAGVVVTLECALAVSFFVIFLYFKLAEWWFLHS